MSDEWEDFAKAIDKSVAVIVKEKFVEGVKGIVQETHEKIIKRTPLLTGKLKANWVVSLDERETARVKETRKKKATFSDAEAAAISRETRSSLDGMTDPFQEVFIQNNLPYASLVEEGGPGIEPHGMVTLTLHELEDKVFEVKEEDVE